MIKIGFNKKLKKVWGDDKKVTFVNQEIIKEKIIFRKWHTLNYKVMISFIKSEGLTVEIGSGAGFFKQFFPQAIASDIMLIPGVDCVYDATKMPFKDQSLMHIIGHGVLHHIYDPIKFFEECNRVLMLGGRILLEEPYVSLFSYFVYRYIHPEHFDFYADLQYKKGRPLMDCNTALPTIIFKNKIKDFCKKFPKFHIIHMRYHSFFIYLLIGGYSYFQLIPNWSFGFFMGIEKLLSPFRKLLANDFTIVIEKTEN